MTVRQQLITDELTRAKAPGCTADRLAKLLGITMHSALGHIKRLRKTHIVLATPGAKDARIKHYRIKHYRIKGVRPDAPPPVARPPRKRKKVAEAERPALSATELEDAIINTLRTHASPRRPMPMPSLREHLQAPPALVRPAVIALVQRETVQHIKGGYHLPVAALHTPQTVATARQVDVMQGLYTGAELRPFSGRPGAMDAYSLPSRGIGA